MSDLADHDVPAMCRCDHRCQRSRRPSRRRESRAATSRSPRRSICATPSTATPAPGASGKLELVHGIEVGHVFKLGTKYCDALDATFLDDKEQRHPIIMGCYGIGVNRIIAALVETSHDDNGIDLAGARSPPTKCCWFR